MRKHWIALLSTLGLAGTSVAVSAQVLKGSKPPVSKADKNVKTVDSGKTSQSNSTKLGVKQQTLRQQNQTGNAGGSPNALTKAKDDAALTKAGTQNQLTKAKSDAASAKTGTQNQLTKGASTTQGQLTKAKNNAALTKGNASTQLTKAKTNSALTKAKTGAQ